jgi:hypothetical protein
MKTIATYAEKVIKENYSRDVLKWEDHNPDFEPYTVAEWCDLESQSDPDFYRWLFGEPDVMDFGSNLTDEELKIASNFFETL